MREFLIPLNEQHLAVLDAALGEVKYSLAAPVIAHINKHISLQKCAIEVGSQEVEKGPENTDVSMERVNAQSQ